MKNSIELINATENMQFHKLNLNDNEIENSILNHPSNPVKEAWVIYIIEFGVLYRVANIMFMTDGDSHFETSKDMLDENMTVVISNTQLKSILQFMEKRSSEMMN